MGQSPFVRQLQEHHHSRSQSRSHLHWYVQAMRLLELNSHSRLLFSAFKIVGYLHVHNISPVLSKPWHSLEILLVEVAGIEPASNTTWCTSYMLTCCEGGIGITTRLMLVHLQQKLFTPPYIAILNLVDRQTQQPGPWPSHISRCSRWLGIAPSLSDT